MTVMEDLSWLYSDWKTLFSTLCSTVLIYLAVIIFTRINGLRTFAKMSSFDFAITIAIGSLIGSTMLSEGQSVTNGTFGLGLLIGLQAIVAFARKRSTFLENLISNKPVLLMKGSQIHYDTLTAYRITESDLLAKLREANVTQFDQVLAAILETTGDISVLHRGSDQKAILSDEILKYVTKS